MGRVGRRLGHFGWAAQTAASRCLFRCLNARQPPGPVPALLPAALFHRRLSLTRRGRARCFPPVRGAQGWTTIQDTLHGLGGRRPEGHIVLINKELLLAKITFSKVFFKKVFSLHTFSQLLVSSLVFWFSCFFEFFLLRRLDFTHFFWKAFRKKFHHL